MLPLATDRFFDTARQTNQRKPHARLVRSREVVTPLGDPRTRPFDARTVGRPFIIITAVQAAVCFGFVALVWWVLG